MPVSKPYREATVKHLNSVAVVTDRPMFGGVSLYSGELIFGLLDNDKLYFKIDETNQPDYEAAGMSQFFPGGDGINPMPYFEVPAFVEDNPEVLMEWLNKSLQVAARKKVTAKAKKK